MRLISLLFITTLFFGCSSKQPNLQGFDLETWKADREGCNNKRLELKGKLNSLKQEIKEVSQNDIAKFFGRPDAQVLDERNKKIFIYYLENGEQCKGEKLTTPSNAETVAFYFNAVSLVTEVTFQRGNP
jgi:hypothetical protein